MSKLKGAALRAAKNRHMELVPQLAEYRRVNDVLWPYRLSALPPNLTTPVFSTDSRGHRITRRDGEEARSDAVPDGAAFMLGGSTAFGIGATSDAVTLPSLLWRETGRPWVNLGTPRWNSTQELIGTLPFADRATLFVLCSGVNNMSRARHNSPGVDPLFAPTFADDEMAALQLLTLDELVSLVTRDEALFAAARGRLKARLRRRPRPKVRAPKGRWTPDEQAERAAQFQLRDLGFLRRILPAEAQVVFALQPLAIAALSEPSREEQEIFDLLDAIQGPRWQKTKHLLASHWRPYGEMIREGCAKVGVPFVDLSDCDYSGWCFVDRVHLTDRGTEIAAAALARQLP